ncbi:MAG: mannosyltransferase family protein [Acidobacteriota bacterium]
MMNLKPEQSVLAADAPKRAEAPAWRRILLFWLVLRVGLSLWALFFSSVMPHSPLEKQTVVWPPSVPVGSWLRRVFLEPWNRWDVEHFLKIAERGYAAQDGTSSFHPLFPLLGKVTGLLFGGNELLGLWIVSNICAVLFLIRLERLAAFDLPPKSVQRVSSYFLMLPAAVVLFAPYTESLFLLCSVLCLMSARQGRWFGAGLAGGLAVLTRQQGLFLLLPLAWEFWHWAGANWKSAVRCWPQALNLLLIPAALLGWLIYRAVALSDVVVDWRQPRTLIYGLLISKSTFSVIPDQDFLFPWQAIARAFRPFSATNAIDLLAGSCYLMILVFGARRLWKLRPSYLLYSLVIVFISFCFSTSPPWAYRGLPRHCLLAFPLVFLLAEWGANRMVHLLLNVIGICWLLFLTMVYSLELLWVP